MSLYHQCVSLDGNDANDGYSWGAAKLTIGAAVAALPNGGSVFLAPTGTGSAYTPASTITINGHEIIGVGGMRQTVGTGAPSKGEVRIKHTFNGNLFNLVTGNLRNVILWQGTSGATGAALYGNTADPSGGLQNSGWVNVSDVVISGDYGWERCVHLVGTGYSGGYRDTHFYNVNVFGATTAGETILLNRVLGLRWVGGFIASAPVGGNTQGVKILDSLSGDISFTGFDCANGDFYTEAGDASGLAVAYIGGRITGNVTCAAGSARNRFAPVYHGGTFTNSGVTSGATANALKQLAA